MSEILETSRDCEFNFMGSSVQPLEPTGENQMPAISTQRRINEKRDESHEIDMQLSRLEDDIRKLKIEFDIYFNGASKRPPLEARARLDSLMKRIGDNRNLSYAQRYLYNTLVSRFVSYRELWRRNLKAKGEDVL